MNTPENSARDSVESTTLFGGICWIGETIILNGKNVVVMDTDMLNGEAKIGEADTNGIVWDPKWVSWEFLGKPNVSAHPIRPSQRTST